MDWNYAIERWRLPLLGIIAGLFAEIGLTEGSKVERLPKPVYQLVLRILRSAESAVRRLIFVAARDIVVEPQPKRPASTGPKVPRKSTGAPRQKRKRRPSFRLFDPLNRIRRRLRKMRRAEPRITVIDYDPRIPSFLRSQAPAPAPVIDEKVDDGTVNAGPLIRRLLAITDALEDIPRQASRLARWWAQPIEERYPERSTPLRAGRPPGFRKRPIHEVDEILKECHWLARNAQPALDTS